LNINSFRSGPQILSSLSALLVPIFSWWKKQAAKSTSVGEGFRYIGPASCTLLCLGAVLTSSRSVCVPL
jgi:hypothetical protein